MPKLPKHMERRLSPTTRSISDKQEKSLTKDFVNSRIAINSGATFGQNDVISDDYEIEAKSTGKNSYAIKLTDWDKLVRKTRLGRVPLMQVNIKDKRLIIIEYDDFLALLR